MIRHIFHPIVLMLSAPKPRGLELRLLGDLSASPISDAVRKVFRDNEAVMATLGFQPPVYATSSASPTIDTCVALYEHPTDGAIGVTMVAVPTTRPAISNTHFTTRFADGWKIVTSNSPVVMRTPPAPRVDGARFLGASLDKLYDMHRARVAERARTMAVMPQNRRGDPIGLQEGEAREIQDYWVSKGIYRYVYSDKMKLTPLGATLAAWRGLFPWKLITAVRADRKARRLATQFGIPIGPIM
jgi:hypothetical protein